MRLGRASVLDFGIEDLGERLGSLFFCGALGLVAGFSETDLVD